MPIGPHPLFTPVSSNNLHSSHQSSSAFNRNSAQQQYLKLMDKIEKLKKQNKKLALEKDKVEVEKQMLMRENERLKGKNLGQMNLDELVVLRKNVESAIKSIDEAKVSAIKFPNLVTGIDQRLQEEKIRQEALDKAKRLTDEQQRCLVCLEKPKCVAFDPCGHVTCCSDCSTKFPPNSNCIVCRKTVNRILKVFIN
jgi:Rad3-related DNA helicase